MALSCSSFTKDETKAVPSVGFVLRAGSSMSASIFLSSCEALMTVVNHHLG